MREFLKSAQAAGRGGALDAGAPFAKRRIHKALRLGTIFELIQLQLIRRMLPWKVLGFLASLPALALATQSLQSGAGTTTLPASGAWTNLANWRAELRIHNFTFDGTYQTIFVTNSFSVRLGPNNYALITSWADKSLACSVSFTGRTDLILRFQRDAANSRLTAEAWNAVDGSGYLQAACPISTPGTPNNAGSTASLGGFKGSLAYVRIYSTVVPLQTAPSNVSGGDLLDYELEGNGKDLAQGINMQMSSAVYTTTPAYPPAVLFGQYPASKTFVAGSGSVTVDGSSSFTATDNATLTYLWQQISGPSTGTFGNSTAKATTFTAPLPGTYVLQLAATDNLGNTGTLQAKYGAVATDANGFIVTGNPAMDYVLGPLTLWGTSPWPWYDLTERADADALLPYVTKYPDPGTPLSGTVTLTTTSAGIYSSPGVVGTGTHFTTELKAGDSLAFSWPTPDGLMGQWRVNVASIADDTHLTLDAAGNPHPFPFIDITAHKIDRSQYTYWGDNQNVTTNWNFYDDALAFYRLYYRTGIDDYLTAARSLADGWYHYALDHGYTIQPPRYASLQGIMARAIDGHPEYWAGILAYMNYPLDWNSQFSRTTPYPAGSKLEPRENGYMLRWAALIAKLHPDPAIRAQWCTNVVNAVTNVWPYVQDDLGNFEEDVYNENPGYPYKAYNGRFGSSPWRGTIALLGLQQASDILNDSTACNNPAVAANALAVMTKFADFVHDYGTGSGRGQLYSVNYETYGQAPLGQNYNQSTPQTAGTLSVTPGSATVTGTGTNFTTVFWNVQGAPNAQSPLQSGVAVNRPTKYIGIPAGNGCNIVFEVASVQSDTQLTLTQPWPTTCPAAANITSSVGWLATWEGDKTCGSLATYCEGGPAGDRSLTHDIHAAYLWTWETTGVQKYLDWATDSLGADYGGPAGGPGTNGPGAGPLADGGHGNFSDTLPPCGTPPCGGYGAVIAMGKAFGMSAGAGDAPNAIAIYTQSQAPAATAQPNARRTVRSLRKKP
ncbi:MAG: PKD domain-containing protein [Terriglobia bacterium]